MPKQIPRLPAMCTQHANSAREALVKVRTLPLLTGENVLASFVAPTVAASVDPVVHLVLDEKGQRRARVIVGATGQVEEDVIETGEIFTTRRGRLARAFAATRPSPGSGAYPSISAAGRAISEDRGDLG